MTRIHYSLFFWIFTGLLSAQTDTLQTSQKAVILKWAPLSLLDPRTPTLQLGLEYFFRSRWSIQSELGVNLFPYDATQPSDSFIRLDDYPSYSQRQFKSRTEVRYFLSERLGIEQRGAYLALEAYYVRVAAQRRNNSYIESFEQSPVYNYDHAFIRKDMFGNNLKFGFQSRFNRIILDGYAGLGYRISNTRYHARITHTSEGRYGFYNYRWLENTSIAGLHSWYNLALGLKVGYLLTRPSARRPD